MEDREAAKNVGTAMANNDFLSPAQRRTIQSSGQDHRWMKRLDPKPGKVAGVECQNPADAMHVHDSHKPCVVYLGADDGISGDETLPFFVNRRRIRQERKHRFDFADFAQGKCRGNPKPLAAVGRVITFQNSQMFCKVK